MRLAILVFVVAKNTRSLLSIASELAFRAGFAIAGAKALIISGPCGTTKVVPWSFYIFSSGSRLNQLGWAEFEGKGIEQRGWLGHFFAQ